MTHDSSDTIYPLFMVIIFAVSFNLDSAENNNFLGVRTILRNVKKRETFICLVSNCCCPPPMLCTNWRISNCTEDGDSEHFGWQLWLQLNRIYCCRFAEGASCTGHKTSWPGCCQVASEARKVSADDRFGELLTHDLKQHWSLDCDTSLPRASNKLGEWVSELLWLTDWVIDWVPKFSPWASSAT